MLEVFRALVLSRDELASRETEVETREVDMVMDTEGSACCLLGVAAPLACRGGLDGVVRRG